MAPGSVNSPYENSPLGLGSRDIRLVKVLPGSSSPIQCQFVSVVLDQCPPYAALSYTWGSPGDGKEKILLGDVEMPVGRNLFNFLLRLRRNRNSSYFWIDALCINQDDLRERSDQVRLMRDIYSSAYRVVIWLGEASPEDYAALRLVKEAYREAPRNPTARPAGGRRLRGTCGSPAALAALYGHEYWTRVWIVQEVMYARRLVIYWGKATLPWAWLARASDFPTGHRLYASPAAILLRAKAAWGGPVPLAGLLAGGLHLCSTDVRDKVFGLLGLALPPPPGGGDGGLRADYSLTPEEVFHAACGLVCRSRFFACADDMLAFSRNLRDALGVAVPERRLWDLVRESGLKGRGGSLARGPLRQRTKGRSSRAPTSSSHMLCPFACFLYFVA